MKMATEGGSPLDEAKRLVLCKRGGYPFYATEKKKGRAGIDEDGDEGDKPDLVWNGAEEDYINPHRTRGAGVREGKLRKVEQDRQDKIKVAWDQVLHITIQ